MTMTRPNYQPDLRLRDPSALDEIKAKTELGWFHRIQFDDYVTPGFPYHLNWEFVAGKLRDHAKLFKNAEVLEPGCADGLWTMWLKKLGAKHILSTDVGDREQFRLVVRAFGLPVEYVPRTLSTMLPRHVRRSFDVVCSLGLLYHVHDPLTTLAMYRRYLKDGGYLVLETAAMNSEAAYMQYTGGGEVYGKSGGNQFLQSVGFLKSALNELGMDVVDVAFRSDQRKDQLGADVGRVVIVAKKTRPVEVHHYGNLVKELNMDGEACWKELWYNWTV